MNAVDELSTVWTMLSAAAIIIREGLEVSLVLGSVLACLRAVGAPRRDIAAMGGGVLAALLGVVMAWRVVHGYVADSAATPHLVEGIACLLAAAVLFYVIGLFSREVGAHDWDRIAAEQVERARRGRRTYALAGLAFFVVVREGLEVALFYEVLLLGSPPVPVLLGAIAGTAVISVILLIMRFVGRSLSIQPLLAGASALLLLLAVAFTGTGVHALQEAGLVGVTPVLWFPGEGVFSEVLGAYPTVETLAAQALCLLAIGSHSRRIWMRQPEARSI